jgi:hypothetical protein
MNSSHSVVKEISHLLRNLKFPYRVFKSRPLKPVLLRWITTAVSPSLLYESHFSHYYEKKASCGDHFVRLLVCVLPSGSDQRIWRICIKFGICGLYTAFSDRVNFV